MPERPKTRFGIPIDEDGFVPESALLKRYDSFYRKKQREYDNARADRKTDIWLGLTDKGPIPPANLAKRDYDNTADIVIPLRCTPEEVAAWWEDPSTCDVEDIDTAGAPKRNIPEEFTPAQKAGQERIAVVATPAEEKKLRRELLMAFDKDELKIISEQDPTFGVRPAGVGWSGRYISRRDRIELDRKAGLDQTTIAHEGTHMLRDRDPKRKDPIITRNDVSGVEESCTVAEQLARSDAPSYTGYYRDVAVYDHANHCWRKATAREAARMAEEDWMLFTHGRGKALTGDEALESVKDNWARSHISRMWTDRGLAINVMAREHGNVDRVSMAKPRTHAEQAVLDAMEITNATAGRPGVVAVAASKKARRKSRRASARPAGEYSPSYYEKLERELRRAERNDDRDAIIAITREMSEALMSEGEEIPDARAYLDDSDYGELSRNSRWKYDSRETNKAFLKKKRQEASMFGDLSKRGRTGGKPCATFGRRRSTCGYRTRPRIARRRVLIAQAPMAVPPGHPARHMMRSYAGYKHIAVLTVVL